MAAHLVEMKSFLLLPRSEEGERMKQELTGQLIEYDQCRRMAALLRAKGETAPVFVRRPMEMELDNTYALHHAPQILADYWQALAVSGSGSACSTVRVYWSMSCKMGILCKSILCLATSASNNSSGPSKSSRWKVNSSATQITAPRLLA